jgi:hypothetical protein
MAQVVGVAYPLASLLSQRAPVASKPAFEALAAVEAGARAVAAAVVEYLPYD